MRDLVKLGGLAVVAALLLAACGGDDESATPESSTSAPSSTTTAFDREAEEQAVIDAYLAELDAFYAAANPPDPDHPDLEKYATGEALRTVQENLTRLRTAGLAIKRGAQTQNSPRVVSITADRALIEDCATDADVQFRLRDSKVIDDDVLVGRYHAVLVKTEQGWLLTRSTFEELPEPC